MHPSCRIACQHADSECSGRASEAGCSLSSAQPSTQNPFVSHPWHCHSALLLRQIKSTATLPVMPHGIGACAGRERLASLPLHTSQAGPICCMTSLDSAFSPDFNAQLSACLAEAQPFASGPLAACALGACPAQDSSPGALHQPPSRTPQAPDSLGLRAAAPSVTPARQCDATASPVQVPAAAAAAAAIVTAAAAAAAAIVTAAAAAAAAAPSAAVAVPLLVAAAGLVADDSAFRPVGRTKS